VDVEEPIASGLLTDSEVPRYQERVGSITIWLLGLGMCLLVLGGLGMDMWRTLVVHSRLSGMAEAIATAALLESPRIIGGRRGKYAWNRNEPSGWEEI